MLATRPISVHQRANIPSPASRFYWPNNEVKDWLGLNWDAWAAAPPRWFTPRFVARITKVAPPELLPLTVLRELALKHSKEGQGMRTKLQSAVRAIMAQNRVKLSREDSAILGLDSSQQEDNNSRPQNHQFEDTSREELVRIETERRARTAFARAKQLWIWIAAPVFGYIDLVTTVVVGLQYLRMETPRGTSAAHITFAMLSVSLGVQTLATHVTGTKGFPIIHFYVQICRYTK